MVAFLMMHLQCVMPVIQVRRDQVIVEVELARWHRPVASCYQCGLPDHLAHFHRRKVTSTPASAGRVEPPRSTPRSSARPPPGTARVNQCALTRDRPTSPLVESSSYRIDYDDETLALMQSVAQYADYDYADNLLTAENNNPVTTPQDTDSHVVISHVSNHADVLPNNIPVQLSKMRYRDVRFSA